MYHKIIAIRDIVFGSLTKVIQLLKWILSRYISGPNVAKVIDWQLNILKKEQF